jgi:cyanophycin synthetase
MVERFIRGNEHRLLVVGGRVVAANRGETVSVVGDGVSSIAQLIDSQINTDPRRGEAEEFPLNFVLLEREPAVRLEIARQGFTPESVPPAGKTVLVQRNGNMAFDVTDRVHPKVAATAVLAARIVGLDIAGIDMVAEDISRPLQAQGGAIVEVNAGPGLLMHLKPADGPARPVGAAIVDHLFPENDSARIPVVGVTGSEGTNMVARLIARLLDLKGAYVGLACSDGLYLNQRRVEKSDCANWESAERVLMNRAVQAAVIENGSRTILSEGLAYDRCQVGVVTNIDPEGSLPEFYIDDAEQMCKVMRTQVDVVLPEGTAVLNAADERVAELAPLCDGDVIFFSITPETPALVQHREQGGRAVFIRDGRIVMATGAEESASIELVGIAHTDTRSLITENILAAVGAAWALDLPADLIRAGIESFDQGDDVM